MWQTETVLPKNIFACLFSVHNTISLPRHEQVCLIRVRLEILLAFFFYKSIVHSLMISY